MQDKSRYGRIPDSQMRLTQQDGQISRLSRQIAAVKSLGSSLQEPTLSGQVCARRTIYILDDFEGLRQAGHGELITLMPQPAI